MSKRITIHIHLDGKREITKELPEGWDYWAEHHKAMKMQQWKMELINDSVDWTIYDPDEELEP